MNPEIDECGSPATTKDPRKKRVFQRRLQNQISESRMLLVLDRSLQQERPSSGGSRRGLSNQELDEQENKDKLEEEEEQELVCVSKMVKVSKEDPTILKSSEFQTGGVLKTVRYIHKKREIKEENQLDH